jgi:hypothetical protein
MNAESNEILESAEKYWLAARSLGYVNTLSQEDVQPYHLPDTFDDLDVVEPKMILELFSIELYLKALLRYRTGSYEKTHNLSRLFDNLPESDKEAINQNCRESDEPYSDGLVGSPPVERTALNAEEVLHEVRDYFRRWRYSFDPDEMKPVHDREQVVPEIFGVPKVIRNYVRSLIKDQTGA